MRLTATVAVALLSFPLLRSVASADEEAGYYHFDESGISRKVLENYLERSVTMAFYLVPEKPEGRRTYPFHDDDARFITNIGAKFIGRAIYGRWGLFHGAGQSPLGRFHPLAGTTATAKDLFRANCKCRLGTVAGDPRKFWQVLLRAETCGGAGRNKATTAPLQCRCWLVQAASTNDTASNHTCFEFSTAADHDFARRDGSIWSGICGGFSSLHCHR